MTIPQNITKDHVLKAIKEIDEKGVPPGRGSKTYFLIHDGKKYPPKYVISLANKYANGEELDYRKFNAQEAVRYLEKLGFEIVTSMFGDEEIREIRPAVEELREKGFSVEGPIPADSVFHLAKEGHYDAVISLYHDQGHIATKTLDFHRTVSLTLGLPFLRTSVDHGTAFDLAGTGRANELSMVEAILAAARYGPRWLASGS